MKIQEAESSKSRKYLLLQLDSMHFGIPIQDVLGIVPGDTLVAIAHMPEYIPGVIRLRGRVVPVVDLRVRLARNNPEHSARSFLIAAVRCGKNGRWEVGLIAHTIINIFEIPVAGKGKPLITPTAQDEFITGTLYRGEYKIYLLDLKKILFSGHTLFTRETEVY